MVHAIIEHDPAAVADDTITKSCKVAALYNESTFNDFFIKGSNSSIGHSLCGYWATHTQAVLTDIPFEAASLLAIKNEYNKPLPNHQHQTRSGKPYTRMEH